MKQPRLDKHHRDKNGEISKKHGKYCYRHASTGTDSLSRFRS